MQRFHDMVKQHRDTLKALQEQVGTTAGNPIIAAGSTLLGKAAGVIDLVRTEGISKSLRDDYAAFSLAAISYSMLHTTSLGLGNPRVASLAERHLTDYAGAIERINEIMPGSWSANWPRTDTRRTLPRLGRPERWWPRHGRSPSTRSRGT